jgi:hypothetical protein
LCQQQEAFVILETSSFCLLLRWSQRDQPEALSPCKRVLGTRLHGTKGSQKQPPIYWIRVMARQMGPRKARHQRDTILPTLIGSSTKPMPQIILRIWAPKPNAELEIAPSRL